MLAAPAWHPAPDDKQLLEVATEALAGAYARRYAADLHVLHESPPVHIPGAVETERSAGDVVSGFEATASQLQAFKDSAAVRLQRWWLDCRARRIRGSILKAALTLQAWWARVRARRSLCAALAALRGRVRLARDTIVSVARTHCALTMLLARAAPAADPVLHLVPVFGDPRFQFLEEEAYRLSTECFADYHASMMLPVERERSGDQAPGSRWPPTAPQVVCVVMCSTG